MGSGKKMKRFLSWAVAWAGAWLFRVVAYWFFTLLIFIFHKMYSLSEALFWVCLILGGSTVLSICGIGIVLGSQLVISGSQAVRKSAKGTRYTVLGICNIAVYAIDLVLIISGVARSTAVYIAAYIAAVIFGIAIIVVGKQTVAKDGAPPTKEEELEAKLKKLKEKENRAAAKKPEPAPAQVETKYTIDESYVSYLLDNVYGITEEEAREFCYILAEFHNNGKAAALTRFDKMIEKISENDVIRAVTIAAYLSGAFVPNGVLTKEESDDLSRSYTKKLLDRLGQTNEM